VVDAIDGAVSASRATVGMGEQRQLFSAAAG